MKLEKTPSDLLPIDREQQTVLESNEPPPPQPETTFDDLAGLASHICEAPLGCISSTEAGKQWFKVQGELPEQERQRDMAFCSQARVEEDILEIPDATQDKRYASNALVTAEPAIRFFAGTPLLSGTGEMLGTLCVVDHKSHTLSETQKEALKTVARQVIAQLELRRHMGSLRNGSNGHATTSGSAAEALPEREGTQKVRVEGRSIAVFRSVENNDVC
jgi:GAF domain-containing protein